MIDLLATLETSPPEWTVDALRLSHQKGEVKGCRALVRSDNGETLEFVSEEYQPIQNSEVVELAQQLGYPFQGARVSHDGRRVFQVFQLPSVEVASDEVSLHLCLLNGHGCRFERPTPNNLPRTAVLSAHLIYRRLACMNVFDSLWYQRGQTLKVDPHTPQAAEQLRSWITENIEQSLLKANQLLAVSISPHEFSRVLEQLFVPDMARLTEIWQTAPDLEPIRHSGWGVYQALAADLTHHEGHSDEDWWLERGHEVQQMAVGLLSRKLGPVRRVKWDPATAYRPSPEIS